MTAFDTTKAAEAATRAADLADKAEAAGMLVVASVLRGVAADLEELVIVQQQPQLPAWQRGHCNGSNSGSGAGARSGCNCWRSAGRGIRTLGKYIAL